MMKKAPKETPKEVPKEAPKQAVPKEALMSKGFICITQSAYITNHAGASGIKYESMLEKMFEVKNKQDIEYFSSFPQRFKPVSWVKKILKKEKKSGNQERDTFKSTLNNVKDLSDKSKEALLHQFDNLPQLYDEVVEVGNDLTDTLSIKQMAILREALSKMDRP